MNRATTDRSGAFTLRGLRPRASYTVIAELDDERGHLTGRSDVRAPDTDVRITLGSPEVDPDVETPRPSTRVSSISDRSEREETDRGRRRTGSRQRGRPPARTRRPAALDLRDQAGVRQARPIPPRREGRAGGAETPRSRPRIPRPRSPTPPPRPGPRDARDRIGLGGLALRRRRGQPSATGPRTGSLPRVTDRRRLDPSRPRRGGAGPAIRDEQASLTPPGGASGTAQAPEATVRRVRSPKRFRGHWWSRPSRSSRPPAQVSDRRTGEAEPDPPGNDRPGGRWPPSHRRPGHSKARERPWPSLS